MAITTAGFQGPVTESQEANRFYMAASPVMADGAAHCTVTPGGGRRVTVGTGTVIVCGVVVSVTAAETVTLAGGSGRRRDVVAVRVTWAGSSSRAEIVAIQGPNGGRQYPSLRANPGTVYEAPLAVVEYPGGTVAAAHITRVVPTGGRGGPLQVPSEAHSAIVPAHDGAQMECLDTGSVWVRRDGAWVQSEDWATQWRHYDPVLRYRGAGNVQAGTVQLGAGGTRKGRFKVVDRFVIGEVEIRRGPTGYNFGRGGLTIDLPAGYAPDNHFVDRWMDAHCYTTAEQLMDWHCQALIRNNEAVANLWAPKFMSDCRMHPARAADASGRPNTGIPAIATSVTAPDVITMSLFYSLGGGD